MSKRLETLEDETQDWDIGRTGRLWTGPEGLEKLERLPGRLELVRGKLCLHESERRALLAGLLENVGLDEVVQLGRLQDWQQAITARAELERECSASSATETPPKHRNCRVIEFPQADGDTWYAIHEVYYEHGRPSGYTTSPAAPSWSSDDGPAAGLARLEKIREALRKPILKTSDFDGAGARVELLEKLGQMIEQSGGVFDMADIAAWFDVWVTEPLLELNGRTPADALLSENGRRQVEILLERMRGGLPG